MNGNSDIYMSHEERRRMRRERRMAMRGQCDSFAHAIRGPLTLVTVGVLFALNNFFPAYGFDKTWPVILIVFGFLTLIGRSTASPIVEPPPAAPPAGHTSPPPYTPPPPYTAPPSSGYRQSPYAQPAAGSPPDASAPTPAKGGFGTSAPPRQSEPSEPPPPGGPA
jgi:hypothetical protein